MGASEEPLSWDPNPPQDPSPQDWVHWANDLPICRALGLVTTELADGRLLARVETAPVIANPNGSVHGGLQLAIADHCMGIVAISALPPGMLAVTANVHGSFHRPALPPLTVTGRVLSAGRTLVQTEIELLDERGQLCTSAYGAMVAVPSERVNPSAGGSG